jgi:hypothetical protein
MSIDGGPDIIKDGLVLCLDAGNRNSYNSGSNTWFDLSVNRYTGSLVNGPTFNSSNNGSIVFDGTNDYSVSGLLSGSFASFTVLTWFYPTLLKNYANVVDCNYAYNATTGNIGPRLEFDAGGVLGWVYSNITNNGASYYGHSVVASGLAVNTWHFAAITYVANSSTTYYNGMPTGLSRVTAGSPTGFIGTMNNLNIGRGYSQITTSERYLVGRVSSVQIYNRTLSATEVLQNYNANKGRFGL